MRLYGFATEDERALFELLVGVSSIGPRLALNMLSSIAAVELQHAISHSDVARLQTIPGIGRKTAERVVLELQEKVSLVQVAARGPVASVAGSDADHLVGDVVSALLNLGYKRGEAEKAVHRVKADTNGTLAVEEWLREALQQLAR
jgi:Holliday junction DNA helicase RuvA